MEHVPRTGPVILASNHLSFIDSVVIPLMAPRKVGFLAKADYFHGPGLRGTLQRLWFEGLGMLPVDRDDTQAASPASRPRWKCSAAAKPSASTPRAAVRATAASTAAAPASPTSPSPPVSRSFPSGCRHREVQPVGTKFPRFARITVAFGAPLTSPEVTASRSAGPREVTDEIMSAIQALSGQEPAGVYNERAIEA